MGEKKYPNFSHDHGIRFYPQIFFLREPKHGLSNFPVYSFYTIIQFFESRFSWLPQNPFKSYQASISFFGSRIMSSYGYVFVCSKSESLQTSG